ncbi:hypothetical protein K431DRAFT_36922 [Polychaeton citri CBS 116435]|uniref:Uncharacterized protein n=1 Tax=Polychaeton citri CBS 116435 TaxID=1314669 RepID=A0A9P4UQK6_9PEZI|nr:hypothetical protein K431DRAFT_36922 [Polychaeton citri CBS 116435]
MLQRWLKSPPSWRHPAIAYCRYMLVLPQGLPCDWSTGGRLHCTLRISLRKGSLVLLWTTPLYLATTAADRHCPPPSHASLGVDMANSVPLMPVRRGSTSAPPTNTNPPLPSAIDRS